MTTPSYKVLVRVLPVAGFLAVVLAAALLAAPGTFRYRGWPKPAPSPALQSLVGLTPELDARDPIGRPREQLAVTAVRGARVMVPSPTLLAGVTAPAMTVRSRPVGRPVPQAAMAGGNADAQAQRIAPRNTARAGGPDRRTGMDHAKRSPESKPASTASEARIAWEAQTYRPRPSLHRYGYHARRGDTYRSPRTLRGKPRRPEWVGHGAARWAHAGHPGARRHLGRGRD